MARQRHEERTMRLLTKVLLLAAAAAVLAAAQIEASGPVAAPSAEHHEDMTLLPAGYVPPEASWGGLFYANWR
jgi:hypothetical protein